MLSLSGLSLYGVWPATFRAQALLQVAELQKHETRCSSRQRCACTVCDFREEGFAKPLNAVPSREQASKGFQLAKPALSALC